VGDHSRSLTKDLLIKSDPESGSDKVIEPDLEHVIPEAKVIVVPDDSA
jgi:hypothetical protein